MEKIKVHIQKIAGNDDIPLPKYMTGQAAGMDIFAAVPTDETLLPGQRRKIPTGIAIALPEGYEAQIRPRSGLALKHGITLLNAPGTIDEGYRGELGVILVNLGQEPFEVSPGMRIAQMVVAPVLRVAVAESETLGETRRGDGGFGSTGV